MNEEKKIGFGGYIFVDNIQNMGGSLFKKIRHNKTKEKNDNNKKLQQTFRWLLRRVFTEVCQCLLSNPLMNTITITRVTY